jgi:archaellum component FlaF (FlaF/FlaG flagellin family)
MENVLPALLAFAIMMITAVTTVTAADRSIDNLADSWKSISETAEQRKQTELAAVSADVDLAGTGVTIQLENAGSTTIASFSRIDVIVEYVTEIGMRETVSLAYVAAVPAANEWTVTGIDPDTYDPRMVNPGETMELTLRLANAVMEGHPNRAIVVAPAGAGTSVTFTRVAP